MRETLGEESGKSKENAFKNDLDFWFVVIPLLVQEQQQQLAGGAVKRQDDSTGVGICWVRRGRVHAWGTRLLEVMSWPGDNPLNTLLPVLLAAPLAAAGPLRLLEGHWDNLGIPEMCSPSSKPPFVPKRSGQLGEASSCCFPLLCLFNLMPF